MIKLTCSQLTARSTTEVLYMAAEICSLEKESGDAGNREHYRTICETTVKTKAVC